MSSAKHGGLGHWKSQRISSVLLVPLILWLLWAFTQLAGADYAAAAAFFRSPNRYIAMPSAAPAKLSMKTCAGSISAWMRCVPLPMARFIRLS